MSELTLRGGRQWFGRALSIITILVVIATTAVGAQSESDGTDTGADGSSGTGEGIQTGGDGGISVGTLESALKGTLEEFLRTLFLPIKGVIEEGVAPLIELLVETPHPDAVFGAPANAPWIAISQYYWETMIPLSLTLWGVAVGLIIFLESTSYLFSSYHRSKLKRRALVGLLGILSWWWIAALSLQLVDAITQFVTPDLAEVSLFQSLSLGTMGLLGLVVSLGVDFSLFVLVALIYFVRQVVLYLFVLLMPLLIALWVPGVGPLALSARVMRRLAGFYVPFLFMCVPVALLFRLAGLLGESFSLSLGGVGAWLTALVIPIVAVVSPFVLFWQAGAIFFAADRASRHVSTRRLRQRASLMREGGIRTAHGGREFLRGMRGKPSVRDDGQTVFESGRSRAHTMGSRLSPSESQLGLRDRGSEDKDTSGSSTYFEHESRYGGFDDDAGRNK